MAKAPKAKPKMGRPTVIDQDVVDRVCEWVAEGKSVKAFAKKKGTPAESTIHLNIGKDKDFSAQYARAKEACAEMFAQEMLQIADDCALDKDAISKAKLQIDARKWTAARLKPKVYGDRLQVDDVTDPKARLEDMGEEELADYQRSIEEELEKFAD